MRPVQSLKTAYHIVKQDGLWALWYTVLHKLHLEAYWERFWIWQRRGWNGVRQALMRRICRVDLWQRYNEEASLLVTWLDFSKQDIEASRQVHRQFFSQLDIRSMTWFIPDFYHPFYGGIYTILRFAQHLRQQYGVQHQFVIVGTLPEEKCGAMIAQAFPDLAGSQIRRAPVTGDFIDLESTDAAAATLWSTAYFLLRFNQTKRKFYFIQDFEPLFYPAGSTYAQVEATYRFGFYGIANTPTIEQIYRQQYGGISEYFLPCVDTRIFYPAAPKDTASNPYRVFFYGRPGHPRNGFELGAQALRRLKAHLGEKVQIVSAGAAWKPADFGLKGVVDNLGLLSYNETASLYRTCDAGLVMMFTRHPSYLPFELMASGCLVVTNFNPATTWLLKDGDNCLLAEASPTCLADTLEAGLLNIVKRNQITAAASRNIQTNYSNWNVQIEKIYQFMCAPKGSSANE